MHSRTVWTLLLSLGSLARITQEVSSFPSVILHKACPFIMFRQYLSFLVIYSRRFTGCNRVKPLGVPFIFATVLLLPHSGNSYFPYRVSASRSTPLLTLFVSGSSLQAPWCERVAGANSSLSIEVVEYCFIALPIGSALQPSRVVHHPAQHHFSSGSVLAGPCIRREPSVFRNQGEKLPVKTPTSSSTLL